MAKQADRKTQHELCYVLVMDDHKVNEPRVERLVDDLGFEAREMGLDLGIMPIVVKPRYLDPYVIGQVLGLALAIHGEGHTLAALILDCWTPSEGDTAGLDFDRILRAATSSPEERRRLPCWDESLLDAYRRFPGSRRIRIRKVGAQEKEQALRLLTRACSVLYTNVPVAISFEQSIRVFRKPGRGREILEYVSASWESRYGVSLLKRHPRR